MRDKKEIGRTGEKVSSIGLGTWNIINYDAAMEAFLYAYEKGIDNIDTAEMYGDGRAEEFVGEFLRRVGRDNIFVTTKIMPQNLVSRDRAIASAEKSLRRLGIDTVDLILLHWSEPHLSLENQIKNLERLAEKGYTRYIGVSNLGVEELGIAQEATSRHEIVVDQVRYSVYDRRVERRLIPYTLERGITIQAYSPIERGAIIGDPVLRRIGEKYGKTEVEVALNYLITNPNVIAIPKTEKKERIDLFIGAMGWRLAREDIEEIRRRVESRYSIEDLEGES